MYSITIKKNDNPLLNEVVISNENIKFKSIIYPNLGASIQKLKQNGIDIIDGISNNEAGLDVYKSKYNSSWLFPFPNRIPNGKYSFENKEYELEINETNLNNRLHGHIFNKSFSIKNQEATNTSASLTFSYSNNGLSKGYPFPYDLEITYNFSPNKLNVNFYVLNTGRTAFPFGIGWHPYFKSNNISNSVLDFKADNQYLIDAQMIPTSETPLKFKTPLELNGTFLDDCFITKQSEASFKTDTYKIDIGFSSEVPNSFLQVYTPDTRDCIAIEPMTCAPNSFNNKNGLLTLEPSKSYNWKVDLKF